MSVQTIDRIGVGSLAKIYAVMGAVYGILIGLPLMLLGESLAPGSGLVSLLFILITSVVGAAVAGAITALIYNLLARAVGGVELHLSSSAASRQSQPASVEGAGLE